MFPRRQDPKCGHNLCCHKLTPIISPFVLLVFPFSCFPLNACSIPGGRKACLFRLVWSLSGCSTVSFICPKNYTLFPSVWSRVHRGLEDTKVAFTSNFRSQRPMRVFTRSSWETTEAEIRALSVWPMQVSVSFMIFCGDTNGRQCCDISECDMVLSFLFPRIPSRIEWAVQGYWWVIKHRSRRTPQSNSECADLQYFSTACTFNS